MKSKMEDLDLTTIIFNLGKNSELDSAARAEMESRFQLKVREVLARGCLERGQSSM